jgi:hypothetical protein
MRQVADGKQREAKYCAPQVEIMTSAVLKSPMHPRKPVKGFRDMGQDNYH